jgi:hypothetical protein
MKKKICKKCLIEKDVCEFGILRKNKDGLRKECKSCRVIHRESNLEKIKLQEKQRRLKNREIINKKQKEYRKIFSKEFKIKRDEYLNKNREKINLSSKKWKNQNQEKVKIWRQKNREYFNNYNKIRCETDILFKIKRNIRSRINKFIKNKSQNTINIIGLNINELKNYLESNFSDGMSWDNYGKYGWHIDHIIPLSSAKNEEEIYKLCHYTNLQPLWAKDNISKGNKLFIT